VLWLISTVDTTKGRDLAKYTTGMIPPSIAYLRTMSTSAELNPSCTHAQAMAVPCFPKGPKGGWSDAVPQNGWVTAGMLDVRPCRSLQMRRECYVGLAVGDEIPRRVIVHKSLQCKHHSNRRRRLNRRAIVAGEDL